MFDHIITTHVYDHLITVNKLPLGRPLNTMDRGRIALTFHLHSTSTEMTCAI